MSATKQAHKVKQGQTNSRQYNVVDYIDQGLTATQAIQAAINEAYNNGTVLGYVYIPAGIYALTSGVEITIYPEILIQGAGSATILDASGWSGYAGLKSIFKTTDGTSKSNFWIDGISFLGQFTAGTGSTFAALPAVSGIIASRFDKFTVSNCYFYDCWNGATLGISGVTYDATMGTFNSKRAIFSNNYCYNCLGGLQAYDPSYVLWEGNHFYDIGDDACAVLSAGGAAGQAVAIGNTFDNGRYLNDNGVPAVGVFLKVDGSGTPDSIHQVIASNNVINNAYVSLYIANATDVSLSDNDMENSYQSAIYIAGGGHRVNIRNNKIKTANTSLSASHAYMLIVGGEDIIIKGNELYGTNTALEGGISITGTPAHVEVKDNLVHEIGGIGVYANASYVDIDHNTFYGSSATQNFILADACTARVRVANNIGSGITTGKVINVLNTTDYDIINNEFTGTKYGIAAQNDVSHVLGYGRVANNSVIRATGSVVDGEPCIQIVANATGNKSLNVTGNVTNGATNTVYLGLAISGVDLEDLRLTDNTSRENKYGASVNFSGTIARAIIDDNDFSNNATYDFNEFATTYTTKEIGRNYGSLNNVLRFETSDTSGTPGNATINKATGQAAFAAGASTVVIANSLVSTTSRIFAILQTADATLTFIKSVVPGIGSFTITGNANATATTKVAFIVFN